MFNVTTAEGMSPFLTCNTWGWMCDASWTVVKSTAEVIVGTHIAATFKMSDLKMR